MERVSVSEASLHLSELVNRVSRDGVTVELAEDNHVVAKLSLAGRRVNVADLNRIFAGLSSLGDDAEVFATDVKQIRCDVPRETDSWA